jgi:hypothetical protein
MSGAKTKPLTRIFDPGILTLVVLSVVVVTPVVSLHFSWASGHLHDFKLVKGIQQQAEKQFFRCPS